MILYLSYLATMMSLWFKFESSWSADFAKYLEAYLFDKCCNCDKGLSGSKIPRKKSEAI